ncbi:MAG: tyrosine--tRNA ligase [Patescibacteria group bacterium]
MFAKQTKKPTEKEASEILQRGVVEVIGKDWLAEKLKTGQKIRVKLGIDPTSPHIHIGRAAALLKMRDFERFGHKIVFIVGDFTGVIGDTSDKETERPMQTEAEVKTNMRTYFSQAGKIINIKKAETKKNSAWLSKLRYGDIGRHADAFSVSDFIARENIKRRLEKGLRVSLRELLYPLMQGYDSVAVKADLEIGGTDQRFNMLAGRVLQEKAGQKPQAVMTLPLLPGTDGRKMSSSWGNTIKVTDEPADMYGKTMSIHDDAIVPYFISVTRVPMDEVRKMENDLKAGSGNPRDMKMRLAREITTLFHGEKNARAAEENFVRTFQKKEAPRDIKEHNVLKTETFEDILVSEKIVFSKNEARRLAASNAIKNMDTKKIITDTRTQAQKGTYKIGKKRFLKIV